METAWRRAIELQPTHVLALASFGIVLCTRQRLDEALPFLERARQADPLASFPYALTGGGLLNCGRLEEALRYLDDALSFEKEDATALDNAGMALVALGRFEEGIAGSSTWSRCRTARPISSARWAGRSRPQAERKKPGRSSRSCAPGRRGHPPSSPRPGCSARSERSMRPSKWSRAPKRNAWPTSTSPGCPRSILSARIRDSERCWRGSGLPREPGPGAR